MIRFRKLIFKNAVTYDHCEVDLDKQGIVFVRGKNRDTRGSNGAGKTTIFEIFQNVIFGSTSTGAERSDLVKGKDYEAILTFKKSGHEYKVHQFRDHETLGSGVKLYSDGQDISLHNNLHTQKLVAQTVGLTPEEFNGCVYLSQDMSHALVTGKASDRRSYLSDLFNLERYDILHKEFSERLKKLNSELTELLPAEAKANLLIEQQTEFDDLEWMYQVLKTNKTQANVYREEIQKLSISIEESARHLEICTRNASLSTQIRQLGLDPAQNIQQEKEETSENLRRLASNQKKLETQRHAYEVYEKAKSRLESLPPIPPNVDASTLQGEMESVRTSLSILKQDLENLALHDRLQKQLSDAQSQFDVNNLPSLVREQLQSELRVLNDRIRGLDEEHGSYSKLDGRPNCPTCGTDLDSEKIGGIIAQILSKTKSTRTRIAAIREQLQRVEHACSYERQADQLKAKLSAVTIRNPKAQAVNIAPLQAQLASLAEAQNAISARSQISLQVREAKADLPSEALPVILQSLENVAQDIRFVTKLRDKLVEAFTLQRQIVSLCLSHEDILLRRALDTKRREHVQSTLSKLTGWIALHEEQYRRALALEAEQQAAYDILNRVSDLRRQIRIYTAITQAYHPTKGLKNRKLIRLAEQVVALLPKYTSKLFSEKNLRFSVDHSDLSFLARRKNRTFDVRRFSGGEKRRLSTAIIFTLSELIARSKRSNVIILDEVEANLDKVGSYLFSNDLLPSLKESYSSIFVISHNTELAVNSFRDFKTWTAVKRDGNSTLQV